MSFEIDRHRYLELFGPTKGDKIRLGDTDLIIEIEKDYTGYGDECKFGGGKVLRDGMGQNAIESRENPMVADLIITGATVVDYTGIYKADIGIRDGKILEEVLTWNVQLFGKPPSVPFWKISDAAC